MARLEEVLCTRHNLKFGFDGDRVRELGQQSALMRCPMCSREEITRLIAERTQMTEHRDLLLKAIDLKALLTPVGGA